MSRLVQLLLLVICCSALICSVAIAGPAAASAPSARDKCPVCGMFVAKFPNWTASVKLRDGTIYFFDGPKDLFNFYLDVARYAPAKRQTDIIAMTVKEYYSLKAIDPARAFFVTGSDVLGPMGQELIPFATEKDAGLFKADHKGKSLLRFNDVTRQLIKSMN